LDTIRDFNADFNAIFDEAVKVPGEDVRGTSAALPTDITYYLNDIQRVALPSIENFGWQLAFVRRPLFVSPMVVVQNLDQDKLAILEQDGSVNLFPLVEWRH
jgi:hypothetical protein